MPDDDRTSPRPTTDEGTHLGASTTFLTRLFAVVMWPIAAVPRVVHEIGRSIRRLCGCGTRLHRLGAIATSIGALLGRAARRIGTTLRPLRRIAASGFAAIGAGCGRLARLGGVAWSSTITVLGVAFRSIG